MSHPDNFTLKDITESIQRAVDEYENQRLVCLSFREHFLPTLQINVWSEPPILLPQGGFKTPDLLLEKSGWLILDYKEITSKKMLTLNSHLRDMEAYRSKFTFRKKVFEPEISIICPMKIATHFKDIVNTIPVLGCTLGKNIRLNLVAGQFSAPTIRKIFKDEVSFPLATRLSLQKFLRHEPKAIAYTAEIVRNVLWQLTPTLDSDEICVTRGDLVTNMKTLYPPYLRSSKGEQFDIQQVTEGRVTQALNFLSNIDFINIKKEPRGHESEDVITASRAKGRNTPNFKQYFIKKEAELIFSKSEKEQKKLQNEEQKKLQKQRKLEEDRIVATKGQQRISKWFTHSGTQNPSLPP